MKISEKNLWGHKFLWIVILLGLSLGFSYLIIIHFDDGGDVTCFSMFFLYLFGYFFGGWVGILCALIFSVIKFFGDWAFRLLDTEHFTAEILDYIFSYGLIGLGGFFSRQRKRKSKSSDEYPVGTWAEHKRLLCGYCIAMLFRYASSVINFLLFYSRPNQNFFENFRESLFYCLGYVGSEMLFTLFLLLVLPWVRNAAEYCCFVATHNYQIDYENYEGV